MALLELALRRGYIGGTYGLLRIAVARTNEGFFDVEDETSTVWLEAIQRESGITEDGSLLPPGREHVFVQTDLDHWPDVSPRSLLR